MDNPLTLLRHLPARRLLCQTAIIALSSVLWSGGSLARAEEEPPPDPSDPLTQAQESFDFPVKYAIYSAAWHLSSNAGLRIVAQNQGDQAVKLQAIQFNDETGAGSDTELDLNMTIQPHAWAEAELPYQNLLTGNDCVEKTLREDWRLVEISNYTLNPSVRGLIIEDTRSFRIYQCVRSVRTAWLDQENNRAMEHNQWLMYHFERLPVD